MPKFYSLNDSVLGEKIYCTFERSSKPKRIGTTGRHNAQAIIIEGNPAVAVIVKILRFVR